MKNTTARTDRDWASYVNTNIGTLSYKTWSTTPTVQLPHGMMEIDPVTTPGIGDKYLADKIFGFSFGPASVTVSGSPLSDRREEHASTFDHDLEETRPYKYRVFLEDHEIDAEMTAAQRSAYFRFHSARPVHVIIDGGETTQIHKHDGRIIEGERVNKGYVCYFSLEMKEATSSFGVIENSPRIYLTYEPQQKEETIEFKVGISYISLEQARKNRQQELPDWDFEASVSRARDAWNRALSAIEVEGGTEEERTIFYTAMYRTLQRMRNITEDGQYYSGFDGKVHKTEGRDFYTHDQLWDTYRCARPLQSIIEPRVFEDMVYSLVRMYEQGGLLPKFPHPGGDHAVMIGHHAASLIADACAKGLDDIHVEKAFEGMLKDATEMSLIPWRTVPATELDRVYYEQGWFPALPVREDAKVADPDEWRKKLWDLVMEKMPNQITWVPEVGVDEWVPEVDPWHRRQSVSVTLERAYDDWCVAQVARKLGRDEEAEFFLQRAGNYRHLFRPDLGLMAPKTAEGEWVEPFDPKLSGGFAGEGYFAEVNSWIYTFHVQHDVEGLIRLMGGREAFVQKLDALFTEQYTMEKPWFLGQFPDMSGLIGMYAHGNEPSFHIPYLYNYAGAPWKTQRRVRDIQHLMYNDGPAGLCGDDDIGSLSSWYVFSAMGFYPVCPGRPVYDIGSPIFEKTTLHVGEGRTFVIEARNVSKANKYIQSAVLNGQPYSRPWLSHQDLMSGGRLVLEMGPRPNKAWGSSPEDAPSSMTSLGSLPCETEECGMTLGKPIYHFTPPANWMNDPNGLIYHEGEYHLFYQYNPYGDRWGTIHWGHAVSTDLVHWQHLPIALAPSAELGEVHCYSGCAVIDDQGVPTLFYTSIGEGERNAETGAEQWMATSPDGLRTWVKSDANPVLTQEMHGEDLAVRDWRDPYVWKEGNRWLMVLGGSLQGKGCALLYESANLQDWTFRHLLHTGEESLWECPNAFRLQDKAVLIYSPSDKVKYLVGSMGDDLRFVKEQEGLVDHGGWEGYYAPQSMLAPDGRRILWGWLPDNARGEMKEIQGWSGVQSIPRTVELHPDTNTLIFKPVVELQVLRETPYELPKTVWSPGHHELGIQGKAAEIIAEFELTGSETSFGFEVFRSPDGEEQTTLKFDVSGGQIVLDRSRSSQAAGVHSWELVAPYEMQQHKQLRVHLFLDHSIVEVFVNDELCLTGRVYPLREDSDSIRLFIQGSSVTMKSLFAWNLRSIW